jgi:hypothetical protein
VKISWIPIEEEIMIKARDWPVRAMYILIAAALAISLFITAAPAHKVSAAPDNGVVSEWSRVSTPTTEDWVLAPETALRDYALADGGDVAYAVVDGWNDEEEAYGDWLLKSDDGAATWEDITDALDDVIDPDDLDDNYIDTIELVATDWVDPDFVAVALWWWDDDNPGYYLNVFFSTDGGVNFNDAKEVEDGVYFPYQDGAVSDLAVSLEAADKRDIVIGGSDLKGNSLLFRCTVTANTASAWEDTTAYDGWDDENDGSPFISIGVTDIIFSPNWATDKTILVTTVVFYGPYWDVYLQSGSMGTTPGWNAKSTLGIDAVLIVHNENLLSMLISFDPRSVAGMTLPSDYNSKSTDTRVLWVWVNYYDDDDPASKIVRVDNDDAAALEQLGQIKNGNVWLTNISYKGTIAEGEAIAGVIGTGTDPISDCCEGVQVYRKSPIKNMLICCESWKKACKVPTGTTGMAVSYVGEDKAYAVALGPGYYDESAWSVSFDDGDVWNQLSLVDTNIDFFSDVAVSPDCNKTMLVSVNVETGCGCDSVWLYADALPEEGYSEYSGHWLRTWCGQLEGGQNWGQWGLLRLAPEETTGLNVYLVDRETGNVYWNDLETLDCWTPIASTAVDAIMDLAAQDKDTLYAVDLNGEVAKFDAGEWQEAVDSEVGNGNTIAVLGDAILVGGMDGDVSYSDDGGETFTALEDVTDGGYVTVAFDTYFDLNDTIYAAVAWAKGNDSGVYRWVIDESDTWTDLKAEPLESQIGINDGDGVDEPVEVQFDGLVVDRPYPANPYTSADNGGVIYASYFANTYDVASNTTVWFTGVARSLEREVTVCTTCLTWDFLHVGLTTDVEAFEAWPDAVKICGCLTANSHSHLFAIDSWNSYDMYENESGSVWTFDDCYSKKAPTATSPAIIAADPCSCYSVPFTLVWDALCDACYYDIQFALDEDFTMPVYVNGSKVLTAVVKGDTPAYSILGGEAGGLSCETKYYWRVRASEAATGQVIHSWWSAGSFTIAPSVEASQITLVAPVPGATGVAIKNLGFSWDLSADADKFDWKLSTNADLTNPVESKSGLTKTNKAYKCTATLAYGTTYYWQVTAYKGDSVISTSAIGTFTTAPTGAFCCPICGQCFDTEALLKAHTADAHPAQPATPFWVWVVIAIGAVLVIVVIVLIFRTRRV